MSTGGGEEVKVLWAISNYTPEEEIRASPEILMVKYIPDCQIYSDFSSHVHQTLQMSDQRSHDKSEPRPPTNPTLLPS